MDVFQFTTKDKIDEKLEIEINNLKEENLNYLKQIDHLNSQIFSAKRLSDLLQHINDAAEANEVRIKQIVPVTFPDDSISSSLTINIHFSSKFRSILKLVHIIETQYLFINIREIKLLKTLPESKELEGQLELSVIINGVL